MSGRRRRLDKKLHGRLMDDVLLGAIQSPDWRDMLLNLSEGEIIRVDTAFAVGRTDAPSRLIRQYELEFELSLDCSKENWDSRYMVEGAITFKLQAVRYPSVGVYAEELPEEIGVPDDVN